MGRICPRSAEISGEGNLKKFVEVMIATPITKIRGFLKTPKLILEN